MKITSQGRNGSVGLSVNVVLKDVSFPRDNHGDRLDQISV